MLRTMQKLLAGMVILGLILSSTQHAMAVDNPVEYHGMADGAAMKFNGEYYFHGIGSDGYIYRSNDLIHYDNPIHCISNPDGDAPNFDANWPVNSEQEWAPPFTLGDDWYAMVIDPNYLSDGKFYTYYQIGTGLGIAIGDEPQQTDWENWPTTASPQRFASFFRIDPNLLRDEDGSLYFYGVSFDDGNEIWGQAMSSPTALTGSPVLHFRALNGTWENHDEGTKIIEGPEVIKYRGKYYCLYAANNTAGEEDQGWGNYGIGVSQSDTPLGFNDAGKYKDTVGNYIPIVDAATQTGGWGRIFNTGQPWVLEGPNGFERWLGYFAHPVGWGRHQHMDRIHFMDKRMTVDGPTNNFTTGYHPDPAMPQYLGLFNDPDGSRLPSDVWEVDSGNWMTLSNELAQVEEGVGGFVTYLRTPAYSNYLFEANLKFGNGSVDQQGGMRAYYADDNNFLLVGLHQLESPVTTNNFYFHLREGGVDNVQAYGLDKTTFPINKFHKIRVEKNGTQFKIWLDEQLFPSVNTVAAASFGAGRVGLYANNGSVTFDGVILTSGWDEYDDNITGWGATLSGVPEVGTWSVGVSGIAQTATTGAAYTFKGDLMQEYECSVQVYRDSAPASGSYMGLMPVAIDGGNFLAGVLRTDTGEFEISGVQGGTPFGPYTYPMPAWIYSDTGQGSGQSWKYTTTDPGSGWETTGFNDSGWGTGDSGFGKKQIWESLPDANIRTDWSTNDIWMRRTFNINQLPSIWAQLRVRMQGGSVEVYINGVRADIAETLRAGSFYKFEEFTAAAREAMIVGDNVLAVHATDTSTPRFIDVGIFNTRLPFTGVDEVNIRANKLNDRVIFFVNGEQIAEITGAEGTWGPSQVGLITNEQSAHFNGILVYEKSTPLPTGWTASDIGAVGSAGRTQVSTDTWTVEGSGLDIWGTSDQFHFAHRSWDGDVTLEARFDDTESATSADYWAKMGMMIREDLDSDSRHVYNQYASNKMFISQARRDAKGGDSGAVDLLPNDIEYDLPIWSRLVRSGNTFTSYHSTDGINWTQFAQNTFTMNTTTNVGLVSVSHNNWKRNTARFSHFRVWAPLPSPWVSSGIGSPGVTGNAGYLSDEGLFYVDGSGADVFNNSDSFQFVHQPWSGDVWFEARVNKIDDTGYWAKIGLMMRESLNADAVHASTFATPEFNPIVNMIRRETTAGASFADDDASNQQVPLYLRLLREGNTFSTYYSKDALAWTQVGSHTFTMADNTYIGMAVNAFNDATLNKAEYDSVRLLGGLPDPWQTIDVGTVGYPGMSGYDYDSQMFEIDASGAEICCTADEFRYVYLPFDGDGSITARVVSLENTGARAKAGVSFRESLTPGSRHFSLELHGSGTLATNRRLGTDGGAGEVAAVGSFSAPYWLRVERSGGQYTCSASSNGNTWTVIDTAYPEAFDGSSCYVGLVVCANTNSDMATAQFDNVVVTEGTAPTAAVASAPDVTVTDSSYQFSITYADNVAIDVSTIGNNDVTVEDSSFNTIGTTLVGIDTNTDGSPRTATYAITPPGGSWDIADNDTYSIRVQANQVRDTSSNAVATGVLGSFTVNITAGPPSAAVASAPDINDGLAGLGSYDFTVTYTDDSAIDVSTLDSNDVRVTGPNGFDVLAQFLGVDVNTDGSPRTATYRIAAPGGTWGIADSGTYTISVEASEVSDTSGSFAAAGAIDSFEATLTRDTQSQAREDWLQY